MLRVLITVTVFMVLTLALLAIQPHFLNFSNAPQDEASAPVDLIENQSEQDVSRDLVDFSTDTMLAVQKVVALPTLPLQPAFEKDFTAQIAVPDALPRVDAAVGVTEISEHAALADGKLVKSSTVPEAVPAAELLEEEISDKEIATFTIELRDDGTSKLEALTSEIIGNVTQFRAQRSVEIPGLRQLVSAALMQGRTGSEIDAMIISAVQKGEILLPGSMLRADGRVDTKMMLASLVEKTQENIISPTLSRHLVTRNDSLASIAKSYYGQTSYAHQIREANRNLIPRAGILTAGQTLVLPSL